jgi:hypothetical protein
MPVVDYYRKSNKVVEIDSSASVEEVYAKVRSAVDARLPHTGTTVEPTSTTSASAVNTHQEPAQSAAGISLGAVA